MNDELRIK